MAEKEVLLRKNSWKYVKRYGQYGAKQISPLRKFGLFLGDKKFYTKSLLALGVLAFKSEQEFLNLLKENGFEIVKYRTEKVKYPMMDLIIRFFIKAGLIKPSPDFYQKHKLLRKLRKIKMPVVGYRTIEVVTRKI